MIRYPTGNKVIDDLCEFSAARMKALYGPIPDTGESLDEHWWIEDRLSEGCATPLRLPAQDGLRACYRWARQRAWERGEYGCPSLHADLLLHQMTELVPTMFFAALGVYSDQRKADGVAGE